MNIFEYFWKYLRLATVIDLIDVLIVAYLLYHLINLIRNTTAERLVKGIVVLLVATPLSDWLQMNVIHFILRNTLELGFIAVVIMFQPELRKMLEQVGSRRLSFFMDKNVEVSEIEQAIDQTAEACGAMSWAKTGALIVFERSDRLDDLTAAGTRVDAAASAELLKNIFYPKAPLHDGAVIVRGGRVYAAGCVLPLSKNENLSRDLGTRHRAAVGMSERSDALCVVVSEETGSISVALNGSLKRHLAPETLKKLLHRELVPEDGAASGGKNVFSKWMVKSK